MALSTGVMPLALSVICFCYSNYLWFFLVIVSHVLVMSTTQPLDLHFQYDSHPQHVTIAAT